MSFSLTPPTVLNALDCCYGYMLLGRSQTLYEVAFASPSLGKGGAYQKAALPHKISETFHAPLIPTWIVNRNNREEGKGDQTQQWNEDILVPRQVLCLALDLLAYTCTGDVRKPGRLPTISK